MGNRKPETGICWQVESDESRNADIHREVWENTYAKTGLSWLNTNLSNKQDASSKGRIVEDPTILTTVARGMGNIGIHVGQEVNEQKVWNSLAQLRNNINRLNWLNKDPIDITSEHDFNIHDIEGEGFGSPVVFNRERYGEQKRSCFCTTINN